ncbi:YybH family protein [Acinetobacter sp. ANC 4648]|uniref:YybH family protein n=1 Tax=Acinetobacter sp. ANC 4648 TaxID=1977875 RepID=UPI000A33CDF6|nr:nuclear transport factor 2 family protein [Acinetobacter sp. ANC 4648]OTG83919.1 ketosteroid isomerase [Acinetobacter sp. ANC 4648]
MSIQIDGNTEVAQEVLHQIELWDQAVVGKHIEDLVDQCANDVSLFDVSSQLEGVEAYKTEWDKLSPYFNDDMHITRRDIKLYTSEDLAILHCYSKVENTALKAKLQMPWCRTTLCLQKKDGQWRVVHQHISMPINMMTGKAVMLKVKPKLRLVV